MALLLLVLLLWLMLLMLLVLAASMCACQLSCKQLNLCGNYCSNSSASAECASAECAHSKQDIAVSQHQINLRAVTTRLNPSLKPYALAMTLLMLSAASCRHGPPYLSGVLTLWCESKQIPPMLMTRIC